MYFKIFLGFLRPPTPYMWLRLNLEGLSFHAFLLIITICFCSILGVPRKNGGSVIVIITFRANRIRPCLPATTQINSGVKIRLSNRQHIALAFTSMLKNIDIIQTPQCNIFSQNKLCKHSMGRYKAIPGKLTFMHFHQNAKQRKNNDSNSYNHNATLLPFLYVYCYF